MAVSGIEREELNNLKYAVYGENIVQFAVHKVAINNVNFTIQAPETTTNAIAVLEITDLNIDGYTPTFLNALINLTKQTNKADNGIYSVINLSPLRIQRATGYITLEAIDFALTNAITDAFAKELYIHNIYETPFTLGITPIEVQDTDELRNGLLLSLRDLKTAPANTYKGNDTGVFGEITNVVTKTAFNQDFETTNTVFTKPSRTPNVGVSNNVIRADAVMPIDSKKQNRILQVADEASMLALVENEALDILLDANNTRVFRTDEQALYVLTALPASNIANWSRESLILNWVNTSTYSLNRIVKYNDNLYRAKQAVPIGQDPALDTGEIYWELVLDATVDYIRTIASRNSNSAGGIILVPVDSTVNFRSSAGSFYLFNGFRSETSINYSAFNPVVFDVYLRNGIYLTAQTAFDSTRYDVGGVATILSANGDASIAYMMCDPTTPNKFAILLGQTLYANSFDTAKADTPFTNSLIIPPALASYKILAKFAYRKDLTGSGNKFSDATRFYFYSLSVGAGGVSSNLTSPAYTIKGNNTGITDNTKDLTGTEAMSVLSFNKETITTSATVANWNSTVYIDATSNDVIITLPAIDTLNIGKAIELKRIDNSSNIVRIIASQSPDIQNIDVNNPNGVWLFSQNDAIVVRSNGLAGLLGIAYIVSDNRANNATEVTTSYLEAKVNTVLAISYTGVVNFGLLTYSSGSKIVQSNSSTFTLKGNTTYTVEVLIQAQTSSGAGDNEASYQIKDITNNKFLGSPSYSLSVVSAGPFSGNGIANATFTPSTDINIQVVKVSNTGTQNIGVSSTQNDIPGAILDSNATLSAFATITIKEISTPAPVIRTVDYTQVTLTANQSVNIGSPIPFNNVVAGNIPMTSNGVFKLSAGKTYYLEAEIIFDIGSTTAAGSGWYDSTNQIIIGNITYEASPSLAGNLTTGNQARAIYQPKTDALVYLTVIYGSGPRTVRGGIIPTPPVTALNITRQISTASIIQIGTTAVTELMGATSTADGLKGIVPTPVAGDETKFLKGDGTWSNSDSDFTKIVTFDANTITNSTFILGDLNIRYDTNGTGGNIALRSSSASSITIPLIFGSNIFAGNGGYNNAIYINQLLNNVSGGFISFVADGLNSNEVQEYHIKYLNTDYFVRFDNINNTTLWIKAKMTKY